MRHDLIRQPGARRPGAAVRRRGARLVTVLSLFLAARGATAQPDLDEQTPDRARALFEQGLASFQAEDFPAARDAFQASFDLRANSNVLYNLANTQRALFEYPASIASFRRYLALRGDEAPVEERAEIEAWVADMESKVARVAIDAPAGATVLLDGQEVGIAPLAELLVTAEPHVLLATLENHVPARAEIRPEHGTQVAVRLQPTLPEPPPPQPIPPETPATPDAPPVDEPTVALGERPDSDWGFVSLGLGTGANLRSMDFANRGFADNFYWTVGVGMHSAEWFAVALDVVLPAVDCAVWARFAFLRSSWYSLAAVPGAVISTGVLDARGIGFSVAAGLLAEFRVWEGLVLSVFPTIGLDTLHVVFVAPLTIGVSYYL